MVLRVLVCDDQALVRAGFVKLLEATDGITVVGEAGDGPQAVELVRRSQPDVVLMDVRMPVLDGIWPPPDHGQTRRPRLGSWC